jgi:hypothetical protein
MWEMILAWAILGAVPVLLLLPIWVWLLSNGTRR